MSFRPLSLALPQSLSSSDDPHGERKSGGAQDNPPSQELIQNSGPAQDENKLTTSLNARPNIHQQSEGPPDLDEVWRNFNKKLNNMFNKKGSNQQGGNDSHKPPNNISPIFAGVSFSIVLTVLAVLWLASGMYIVQDGHQAVVLRFGQFARVTGAGLHFRLPYPIESHEKVVVSDLRSQQIGNTDVLKATGLKFSSMLTGDTNIVDVVFAVQYRIKAEGAQEYLFNDREPEVAVILAAETAVREVVGMSKMDFVLYEGREKIAQDIEQLTQRILDRYGTGIEITSVAMQNIQTPDQVRDAFEDTQKAAQDRERLINEGRAYENDIIPKATGTVSRLLAEAEAYRASAVERARGEASRFAQIYSEYKKAPKVTRDRIYLDTMSEVLSYQNKIVTQGGNNNSIMYLPLDQLLKATPPSPQTAAGNNDESNNTNNLLPPIASSTRDRSLTRERDRNR